MGVNGFPTFILFLRGFEVDRIVGASPQQLESKIEKYYASSTPMAGKGMSLGGTGALPPSAIREARLKKFGNQVMQGTMATASVAKMMDRIRQDSEEEEEEKNITNNS